MRSRSKHGFSLVELLIVVGILAVLAAIAIPILSGVINKANTSSDATNATEMTNAVERFTSEYEMYRTDIYSGTLDTNNLDATQGRVYNVTKATTEEHITKLESPEGFNGVKINPETKYPANEDTAKAIINSYSKTSASTYEPKQSDCHYYYSPDIGIVVTEKKDNADVAHLNFLITSGNNAKGEPLDSTTTWIDLTDGSQIGGGTSVEVPETPSVPETPACSHKNVETVMGSAPTCTTSGMTDGSKCADCGEILSMGSILPANGHTPVSAGNSKPATCEVDGKESDMVCSVCGTTTATGKTIPATGHTYKVEGAKEATCTSAGHTGKEVCSKCGHVKNAGSAIAQKAHTPKVIDAKEATCTTAGHTGKTICSVCNTVISSGSSIPATKHSYVSKNNGVEPTCTTDGKEADKECSKCHDVIIGEVIYATGHNYKNKDNAVAPTCTKDGKETDKECSYCHDIIAGNTIPATGHNYQDKNAVEPTCIKDGKEADEVCSKCGDTITGATIPKLGHDYVLTGKKDATCTIDGHTGNQVCLRCDDTIAGTVITAVGHQMTHNFDNSYVEATCTTSGFTGNSKCSVCGHIENGQVIPAIGHTDGNNDNKCDKCGTTIAEIGGLGNVEIGGDGIENPEDVEFEYDPDDGSVSGIVPPASGDEPVTPPEIPEEKLPTLFDFNYGKFESKTNYTPGEYEAVEYETTYTTTKLPVSYWDRIWSKWNVTKDSNGNVINTAPSEIALSDIDEQYSTYIVYNFITDEALEFNGVKGDSMKLYTIYNSSEDTKDNAVYLAAYLNMSAGNTNHHIAKWDGSKYVAVNCDNEISAIKSFTETVTITTSKQVLVKAPTSTTEYIHLPIGTLQAEEGMTWNQWFVSSYNTTGYTSAQVKTSDFADVSLDSVINPNLDYGFVAYELSGTWKWNDTIEMTNISQSINFESQGPPYKEITCTSYVGATNKLSYINNDATGALSASNFGIYSVTDKGAVSWGSDNRMLNFGSEPQAVSKEFYEWFTTNATKQVEGSATFNDGVTLTWDELKLESNGSEYGYKASAISDTEIGYNAFSECDSLESITLPDSVTTVGYWTFCYCTSLTTINTSSKNPNYCSVDGVLYNKDMTTLIHYPEGKTNTSFTVPNGVTTIGEDAFWNCDSITSITFPSTLTIIGKNAFTDCDSFESINLSNTQITTIDNYGFRECSSLESITLPSTLTSIGEQAFWYCDSLTSVTIPANVTRIGAYAFRDCTALKSVIFKDTTTWYRTNSSDYSGGSTITVTSASTNATNLKKTYLYYYWYKK